MAVLTQGFEFAYSLDATKPWIEEVPGQPGVTFKKGDLITLASGSAALCATGFTTTVLGVAAEAATITTAGSVAVARCTPAHVFRVQYTGTPNAAAIRGGTIDLENSGTVDASDVTMAGTPAGVILDKALDTTNAWAYVRFPKITGYYY